MITLTKEKYQLLFYSFIFVFMLFGPAAFLTGSALDAYKLSALFLLFFFFSSSSSFSFFRGSYSVKKPSVFFRLKIWFYLPFFLPLALAAWIFYFYKVELENEKPLFFDFGFTGVPIIDFGIIFLIGFSFAIYCGALFGKGLSLRKNEDQTKSNNLMLISSLIMFFAFIFTFSFFFKLHEEIKNDMAIYTRMEPVLVEYKKLKAQNPELDLSQLREKIIQSYPSSLSKSFKKD